MGTLIDLHTHTTISSGCSVMEPRELIDAARRRGLDGVCVTDHYAIEGANVTQRLGREMGFPIFRGVEARTDLGDMLVFGYYQDIPAGIPLPDLCWYVHEVGGLVFAAHPFHVSGGPSLTLGFRGRGWRLSEDWRRVDLLRELDGVETVNGQVPEQANVKASELADRLAVPGVGGSDAHAAHMVGTAATCFPRTVASDADLLAALKEGGYSPVRPVD